MRAAARRVGISLTLAVSLLVLAVLVAALLIVFGQIPPAELFAARGHETTIDVDGVDIVLGAIIVGLGAIVLAGTLSLLVTHRAVAPLVEALRRQRRFVADASHELRTPLAILDTRLQVLQRSMGRDGQHAELVAELRTDSRALGAVVTDLLESIEAADTEPLHPLAVGAAVERAVGAMRILALDRGVEIEADPVPAEIAVPMPETGMRRCLVALLDNAIKHAPSSTVTVSTRWTRSTVTIAVIDRGPGIQGIDPGRVFDRFARSSQALDGGGSARTGFGIGLALVQETVTRHGGSIAVEASSAAGTTMSLALPRWRSSNGSSRESGGAA